MRGRTASKGEKRVGAAPPPRRAAVTARQTDFDARSALLDATSDLMRENFGDEPSVVEIAQRAAVNPGLISYYFGGKDNLLLTLLTRDFEQGQTQLRHLIGSRRPVLDKLRIHISGLINLYYKYPYLNQLTQILVRRGTPAIMEEVTEKLVRPIFEAHKALLEEGIAAGDIRPVDPMFFYFTVLGACHRIFDGQYSLSHLFGYKGVDEAMKRKLIRHTTDMLLSGIAVDKKPQAKLMAGDRPDPVQ